MKAIVYQHYGTPDELQLQEVEKPVPAENEVLVKVKAASINSWDWDLLTGKPYIYRLMFGLPRPKFKIIGADIAGVVEAGGNKVERLKPGDEVMGDLSAGKWGGFAEYVCVPEDSLALKSSQMSFHEAAAIPQAGVLALQGLNLRKVQPGQKVLINGAGGGVGNFAIQLAKRYGAEVTAVDRASKLEFMKNVGADRVIDFKKQNFTKTGEQYDLILDVIANQSIGKYIAALNPGGIFVVVGGKISSILQVVFLGSWFGRDQKKEFKLLMHKPNVQDLEVLKKHFEAGVITPNIDRTFSLSETTEAFRYYQKADHKGKVIITMDSK